MSTRSRTRAVHNIFEESEKGDTDHADGQSRAQGDNPDKGVDPTPRRRYRRNKQRIRKNSPRGRRQGQEEETDSADTRSRTVADAWRARLEEARRAQHRQQLGQSNPAQREKSLARNRDLEFADSRVRGDDRDLQPDAEANRHDGNSARPTESQRSKTRRTDKKRTRQRIIQERINADHSSADGKTRQDDWEPEF